MVVKMSAVLTDRQLSIQPTVQPDTVPNDYIEDGTRN